MTLRKQIAGAKAILRAAKKRYKKLPKWERDWYEAQQAEKYGR